MSLLSVRGVTKSFGGLLALNAIDLEVAPGTIHGLMGANGAGKTTLFSIIAGNQRPTRGEILFDGARIDRLRPDQICCRGLARTFQIVRPFPGMTARENVETGILFGRAEPPSHSQTRALADEILSETGLETQADMPAASMTLSGRKRLEVARALGTGPRLLMLDEVMAGLTPTEVAGMIEALRRIHARYDLTVLIVEHVMSALLDLSDEITVLHHGERIAQGRPKDIARDPRVTDAYFGAEDESGEEVP